MDPLVGIWSRVGGCEPKYRWAFDAFQQAFYDNNMRGTWTREDDGSYVIQFPGYQSRGYLIGNHRYVAHLQDGGRLTLAWERVPGEFDPPDLVERLGPVNQRLDWDHADSLRGFQRKKHPYND